MEGLCAGGWPGVAAGQGGAPFSTASGIEGDQGGASEGGLGSEACGKYVALELPSRSSSPGSGHGA
jgi:hypothetical protein